MYDNTTSPGEKLLETTCPSISSNGGLFDIERRNLFPEDSYKGRLRRRPLQAVGAHLNGLYALRRYEYFELSIRIYCDSPTMHIP
jgi:hypothetical protein